MVEYDSVMLHALAQMFVKRRSATQSRNEDSGEEITSTNPIECNLNGKSRKFRYVELWWSSGEKEKKSITIYESINFHMGQFNLDRQEAWVDTLKG